MRCSLVLLVFVCLSCAVLAYDEKFKPPEIRLDDDKEIQRLKQKCDYKCKAQAGPISNLYYNSGKWLNVFVDKTFNCAGKVTSWVFFAKKKGKVFLTVWRPGRGGWTLMGKNSIKVSRSDVGTIMRYQVPKGDQISVQKKDAIGIQYPRKYPGEEKPLDRGIIPYNNSDSFPWANPTGRSGAEKYKGPKCPKGFSRLINVQIFDEDIDPREPRDDFRFFCRRAAFAAYVCPNKPKPTPSPPPKPTSPCKPNPCKNGGTCYACDRCDYECKCLPCYSGRNCQDSGRSSGKN